MTTYLKMEGDNRLTLDEASQIMRLIESYDEQITWKGPVKLRKAIEAAVDEHNRKALLLDLADSLDKALQKAGYRAGMVTKTTGIIVKDSAAEMPGAAIARWLVEKARPDLLLEVAFDEYSETLNLPNGAGFYTIYVKEVK